MRIVVMGTGPFAVPTAERLIELGHEVPLVVTRPVADPPPKKLPPRPVWEWANSHKLPIFEPQSINTQESIDRLRELQTDLFFVCDYGQILSKECLGAARLGGINLHGSLLPRHRGAAPVQWALLTGDQQAGVTVIHMTAKLDAGPALSVRSLAIRPDETAGELEPRLARIGVEATVEALELLAAWDGDSTLGEFQDRSLVTKAPRFSKAHGQLDFRLPAGYLVRLIRACQPWPGTYADLQLEGGKTIRLLVRAARSIAQGPTQLHNCGMVHVSNSAELGLDWDGHWKTVLFVKCGQGSLAIGRVQPAGKREMDVSEFIRGHAVDGAQFLIPAEPIEMLA